MIEISTLEKDFYLTLAVDFPKGCHFATKGNGNNLGCLIFAYTGEPLGLSIIDGLAL
jgi:hypothetical protein